MMESTTLQIGKAHNQLLKYTPGLAALRGTAYTSFRPPLSKKLGY